MENANFNPDEKRLLLKDYNHRLNNDLQAVLAFIKLKKRFGIDDDEIVTFSCVSIASLSAIQNLMYNSDNSENLISANEFFEEFIKILNDYYSKFNLRFFNELKTDFYIDPKKIFHLMLLINEMVNLSINFSFNDDSEHNISFNLEKIGEECLLTYSDNGSGIKGTISESNMRTALFEQLVKQIDGVSEPSDANSTISIRFSCE